MMSTVVYCPICGKNIKNYRVCPVCGYVISRDCEAFPTLGNVPDDYTPVSVKHEECENKHLEEKFQLLVDPLISKLTSQIHQLGLQNERLSQQNKSSVLRITELEKQIKQVQSGLKKLENEQSPSVSKNQRKSTPGKRDVKAGSIIRFGNYVQEYVFSPIEWRVLKTDNSGILLITEKAIDCKKYHDKHMNVTWETSAIRRWLNNDFLNYAFTMQEKSSIKIIGTPAHKNPRYNTYPGLSTMDQVFLLSIEEARKYLKTENDRKCFPTLFARKNGAKNDSLLGTCGWWLRSPGDDSDRAAYVNYDGSINNVGNRVGYEAAVRPAIWIDY